MIGIPYAGTWPLSQRYGSNKAAYSKWGMQGHNGIDVALDWGTWLLACVAGVVTERANDPTGYGQYTVITDAAGGQWLYGHASSWLVRDGDRVALGQQIGRSGNTGNSTGPHLHLGYRPFGYNRSNGYLGYVNPRPFLPLPYRVLLQAGHFGAVPMSGAPHEAEWTEQLTLALRLKLQAAGVQTAVIGDFYRHAAPAVASEDFDLFLACHYDAAIYRENTGCLIARGDFETEPWEADRFIAEWKHIYPAATGIPLQQERVNPNMTRYYALASLTYVTPGIVIEHGVGAPGVGLDAPTLWDEMERVAAADANAVLAYLGVRAAEEEDMGIINELNRQVADLRAEIDGLHGVTTELQGQVNALHEEVSTRTAERDALQGLTNTYEPRLKEMEDALRQAVAQGARRPDRVEVVLDGEHIPYVPEAA